MIELLRNVFPAQAGMIHCEVYSLAAADSIPRASGDDPFEGPVEELVRMYSPRKRG